MALLPFFRKKDIFSDDEKQLIVNAIRAAEQQTSGELRVYIEKRCRFVDPLDRAAEIFWGLKMDQTDQRNAVLIYIAIKDHQYAVFADDGIHKKLGENFWNNEVKAMYRHFRENRVVDAIVLVISEVGQALHLNFPYDSSIDKNELPDDIVFGS